jgi:hypothetical protein
MKKVIVSFICLILFVLIIAGRGTASGNWNLVLISKIETADLSSGAYGIKTVGFLNETYGIAVGPYGEIRYTVDNGSSWQRANCPNFPAELDGLEILDENTAWCSGGSFNWVTHDGGKNWSALLDYGSLYTPGRYLSFFNRQFGWFGATNQVAVTTDGGANWTSINLPKNVNGNIMAIHLLSENLGYILSNQGMLYRTKNSGQTWDLIRLPLKGRRPVSVIPYAPIEAVRFQDMMHGIVVLYAEKPRGFIFWRLKTGGNIGWRKGYRQIAG